MGCQKRVILINLFVLLNIINDVLLAAITLTVTSPLKF